MNHDERFISPIYSKELIEKLFEESPFFKEPRDRLFDIDPVLREHIANSTPPIMENKPIFEEDYYEDQCWKRDRKDD